MIHVPIYLIISSFLFLRYRIRAIPPCVVMQKATKGHYVSLLMDGANVPST